MSANKVPLGELKAHIKLPLNNLSDQAEQNLCAKGGFYVISRDNEFVELGKPKSWKPPTKVSSAFPPWDTDDSQDYTPNTRQLFETELTEDRISFLNRRCQRIVDAFVDPSAKDSVIRHQLHNFGQRLSSLEQEYVENWAFNYIS